MDWEEAWSCRLPTAPCSEERCRVVIPSRAWTLFYESRHMCGPSCTDHSLVRWEWNIWCTPPFTCLPAKLRTPRLLFLGLPTHFLPNLMYPKCTKNIGAGTGYQTSFFHSLPSYLVPGVTLPFAGQLHEFFFSFLYFGRAAMSVIELSSSPE